MEYDIIWNVFSDLTLTQRSKAGEQRGGEGRGGPIEIFILKHVKTQYEGEKHQQNPPWKLQPTTTTWYPKLQNGTVLLLAHFYANKHMVLGIFLPSL